MKAPDVRVAVYAADPVTSAGLVGILSQDMTIAVVAGQDADVLVAAEDPAGKDLPVLRRAVSELGVLPGILIAGPLPPSGHRWAADAGVRCVLPHRAAHPDRLIAEVTAARSAPTASADRLAAGYGALAEGPAPFHQREIDVLRLIAEGKDTAEIGAAMGYSQRTIKNILHHAQRRLALRNRAEAVAEAIRAGLI
ncbi:LuxR C-terminal-related transcriptional regulator [Amycolatopsis roodepoortensis]|uniref:helix-turn-helix transcriptional regulator n=1 Tax=Amycolatopsis roodepoortensis TaxID=700274 RepID=UPI00214C7FD4|nr:LuxR C-terminal-related transcriptional regulator [Amycolatopsis roodepoortensis]UUV30977.1 LuxR C-terminal-related transcriptional regulator [Amycolatopsis roodepoortensis]